MLGATRLGDFVKSICRHKSSGPFFTASHDTFANGRGQVRLGDLAVPGVALTGSRSYFINGRPAVRLKDHVSCGVILTSSHDTFIGD